jgi:hypothetical protein
MTSAPQSDAHTIVLTLASEGELFAGPPPASKRVRNRLESGNNSWDDIGATLGEPGVERLLRMLHAMRDVRAIVLRIEDLSGADASQAPSQEAVERLRAWMRASVASRRELVRRQRRVGVRILAMCMGLFGVLFSLAWFVQQQVQLSDAGPVRMLITDALVIAGWVILWRPLELLIVDPMQPTLERRVLERALGTTMRVEWARGVG